MNNVAIQKQLRMFSLFGLLLFLGGCVSNSGLSVSRAKNPDALWLTRLQAPPTVKTYIFTGPGADEGYWVDVSVSEEN